MQRVELPFVPFAKLRLCDLDEIWGGQYRASFMESLPTKARVVCRVPLGSIRFVNVMKEVEIHMYAFSVQLAHAQENELDPWSCVPFRLYL